MCFKNKSTEDETEAPPRITQGTTVAVGAQETAISPWKRSSYRYAYRDPHFSSHNVSVLNFESCRYCSDRFTFIRDDGQRINIIAGLPGENAYRAVSYVWGQTNKLHMFCIACQRSFAVPMTDVLKFKSIANLAPSEEFLWLDSMSIDQEDENDIERQLPIMGRIYAEALSVAVLLPQTDGTAFSSLSSLLSKARFINDHKEDFSRNEDPYLDHCLTQSCQEFYREMEQMKQNLHKWTYWSRAWTFQEWAMAVELDMGIEGHDAILRSIKYPILHAATLMAVYKLQMGAFANIELGFSRGEIPRHFSIVKRLFPDELAFLSPDEESENSEATYSQTLWPSLGVDTLLGLRSSSPPTPLPREDGSRKPIHELFDLRPSPIVQRKPTFLSRLSTMLNAFAMSKREARFEVDLVQCWASMCNIRYTYNKHGSYAEALQLALAQLRQAYKVRIFTWQANTNSQRDPVDLSFLGETILQKPVCKGNRKSVHMLTPMLIDHISLEYASQQAQCNARLPVSLAGTPVLTGLADTLQHVKTSVQQPNSLLQLSGPSAIIRAVLQIDRRIAAQMDQIKKTMELFRSAIVGEDDGFSVKDIVPTIQEFLEAFPAEILRTKMLIVVNIRTNNPVNKLPSRCILWAIIPYDRDGEVMVARECTNGQLVLVKSYGTYAEIVGYLVLTHQRCGTYSAWCSENGSWIQKMNMPMRSDMITSEFMHNDLWWACHFKLEQKMQRLR